MTLVEETGIADAATTARAKAYCRARGIRLPTFAELVDPSRMPEHIRTAMIRIDPDAAHPINLHRVHWYNAPDRQGCVQAPDHVVLPESLTGVPCPIILAIGRNFPLIRAHKVLAAYACLAPRLVTGRFNPQAHRAVWPSTGNYCRGGVAISRILGCRGVAVLPEGMSRERFEWLEGWVTESEDIVRTPGTESNVKEIYDRCAELERDPHNVILNQFREFGNHLAHYFVTGHALLELFRHLQRNDSKLELAAFVSASGSAGTLGAGDFLKEEEGARIVAVEALECPTLLCNGYGEHNIQGIGDKHVPLIHNVMNTDLVAAVTDKSTDALNAMFNCGAGRAHLAVRGVPSPVVEQLGTLGLSSLANVLGAIKVAKLLGLERHQAVITVATDGAEMYASEAAKVVRDRFQGEIDAGRAASIFDAHLAAVQTDHVLELTPMDRERIFNLGYFTWVEQRGVSLEDFDRRRQQSFWIEMRDLLPAWDERIEEFNS
jgi:cysteine synthase